MSGKSGPSGTTTTVQQSDPWAPQQPYLENIFSEAQRLYQGPGPQYFPGTTTAPENWMHTAGIFGLADTVAHDPFPYATAKSTHDLLSGNYLNANPAMAGFTQLAGQDNPYSSGLQSYLSGERLNMDNPYTDALVESITSRVLPGIQSQFINSGTLSSPEAARASAAGVTSAVAPQLFDQYQQEERNQLAAAGLLSDMNLRAGGLQSQAFSSGMNDMLRGLALAPQSQQVQYAPYQTLFQTGGLRQQLDQQQINDAVQRWNYGQTQPYNALNQYIGQVTGNYGGTSTLTQPYFGQNPFQSALGGAMGGAQLGSMFGSPLIGGGLGALFGLLSDRRAKEDIMPVGELDNGLTVYSYRYKGEPEEMRHIGLMADEVEEDHPEAVGTLPPMFGALGGLKYVDYARAVE